MCIRNEKGVKLNEMCMFHSSSSNSYTTKLVYYFWWVIFNSNVNCYFIHYSPNHTQYTYRITHQTNAIIVSRNMILCCCCCFFLFLLFRVCLFFPCLSLLCVTQFCWTFANSFPCSVWRILSSFNYSSIHNRINFQWKWLE